MILPSFGRRQQSTEFFTMTNYHPEGKDTIIILGYFIQEGRQHSFTFLIWLFYSGSYDCMWIEILCMMWMIGRICIFIGYTF